MNLRFVFLCVFISPNSYLLYVFDESSICGLLFFTTEAQSAQRFKIKRV